MGLQGELRADRMGVPELLGKYAANQNKLESGILNCEHVQESSDSSGRFLGRIVKSFDVRFDGNRISKRSHMWGAPNGPDSLMGAIPKEDPHYMSISWDGRIMRRYSTAGRDDPGLMIIVEPETPRPDEALRGENPAAVLMGCYLSPYKRFDAFLREAVESSVRQDTEEINGAQCYVIDAKTKWGDCTIWMDLDHGFNIAKVRIDVVKERGHFFHDKPLVMKRMSFALESVRFKKIDDAWAAVEADWEATRLDPADNLTTTRKHITISDLTLDPDHDELGSFAMDDIKNGAKVLVHPVLHIGYIWKDGELIPKFTRDTIAMIDKTMDEISVEGSVPSALTPDPMSREPGSSDSQNRAVLIEDRSEQQGTPESASQSGAQLSGSPKLNDDAEAVISDHDNQAPPPSASTQEAASTTAAKQDKASQQDSLDSQAPTLPRQHCGLHCVYSTFKLAGKNVEFAELVKPEYLGSQKGSSLSELEKAVRDYGMFAGIATRLTTASLRKSEYPVILHVKSDLGSKKYDHYELFLGAVDGKAKLFNPPEPVRLVPFRDLAPRWDGIGLVVSARPPDVNALFAVERERLMMYAAIGAVLVLGAHMARRRLLALAGALSRRRLLALSAGQCAALGLATILFGIIHHLVNDEGLLANSSATASVQRALGDTFIPKINERDVRRLLAGDAVFVDARFSRDFKRGHIKDAINIPVDANDAERQDAVAEIDRNSEIVVYCQSIGCKFANEVAVKLMAEGFSDICIFRGGWNEWAAKNGDPIEHTSKKQDASKRAG